MREDINSPRKITDMNVDFSEIEQIIKDARAYSLGSKFTEWDIYELVRQSMPQIADIQGIIPIIVSAIIARQESEELKERVNLLDEEMSRLNYRALFMEQEINIFEEGNEGVLDVKIDGTIIHANDRMMECSGYSKEELIGKNMHIFSSGTHIREFWKDFWTTIQSGKIWLGDICNKKKDGTLIWLSTLIIPKCDDNGNVTSFKVVRKDIMESYVLRKKLEDAMNQKIDYITGLANHTKCLGDCEIETNRSLIIVHVNNIFEINSAFGRNRGNEIIKEIGQKLKTFAQENNAQVYRMEGTDFAIIFTDHITQNFIQEQCKKLTDVKIVTHNQHIELSLALGIALDHSDINNLLANGYLAMNESKQTKQPVIFNQEIHTIEKSTHFFKMRNLIREAFIEDLFVVFFQEIKENSCAIKKSDIRKFECLIRMYNSKGRTTLISPGVFLSAIKQDGKDNILTNYVVDKVCQFMSENKGYFSINLTEDDLILADFSQKIHEKIRSYSIDPNRITFEVLEEIESIESKNILENIQALKRYAFKIAIDDFGSGYSNFSRMLKFKPDFLKIDMSYIRGIDTNPEHRSIVRAIVLLAHENGIMVIAEGVETENEQLVIESLGVDYSQGYLFSKPSPVI
ncbi:MAG: EAL domain-containing protein [Candidatus Gracilibacteria bacterium]